MRKKIIIYIPNLSGGGTERFYYQLANFLSKFQEYSLTYFYSVDLKNKKNLIHKDIKFRKTLASKSIFAFLEIIFFTWTSKYSLILTAQNHPNVLFSLFRFLIPKRTKLIISERAFTELALVDSKKITSKLINLLIPLSYRNADYIHCLTNRIANHMATKYKLPKKKLVVIPNFVDVSSIEKSANEEVVLKNKDRWFLKSPYIISIGRLHNQKGYKFLLVSFSKIANKIPHNLIILGEGSLLNDLMMQVKELNLEKRVIFPGFVKNPYPLLKRSQLFVLSSLYEGMPNVLLEAIALNVPIVSSDCPSGPKEILGERYKELLYQPKDTVSLSKLILKQINNPKKIPISFLKESFSVERVLKAHDELITKCL